MAASDIRREHVLDAIAEYDRLGQTAFLKRYGFGPSRRHRLVFNGKFYDSKPIVCVAHGFATGEFWTRKVSLFSGGQKEANVILGNLGFFTDGWALFTIEKLQPDMSHGKRAPYQYVVLLWALSRAREHKPRLVPFNDVRKELSELLAPFAVGKTAPDPAMPWAALASNEELWELDRQGLSVVTEADVKRLNMVAGLRDWPYGIVADSRNLVDVAAAATARFIGDEPAFPALLERLGIGRPHDDEEAPEVADAIDAIEEVAHPRARFRRRLSAAENKAIEERAVQVVCKHYEEVLGYATKDVGTTESYDVHATKGDDVVKVEVKGTTSDGSEIVLTANEVTLHLAEHPNNALAVVRRIVLDRSGDTPIATGGELVLVPSWEVDESALKAIAYRYPTGL